MRLLGGVSDWHELTAGPRHEQALFLALASHGLHFIFSPDSRM